MIIEQEQVIEQGKNPNMIKRIDGQTWLCQDLPTERNSQKRSEGEKT